MTRIKYNKVLVYSELVIKFTREIIYGWNTTVPVNYELLDKYLKLFNKIKDEDEDYINDNSNNGYVMVKNAKSHYSMLTDEKLDFFPREKIDKYLNPIREYYKKLENGEWYIEDA